MLLRSLSRPIVLVLAGALLLSACGEESTLRAPAARVNGVAISDATLHANAPLFQFLAEIQGRPCGSQEADETQGAACNREILGNLIQEELIKAYAKANDVPAVTQQEVDDAVAPLLEEDPGTDNQATLAERLESLGLEVSDIQDLARRLLLFGHVREALAESVVPPEDELLAQYEARILEYTTFHAKHILVETEQAAAAIAARATPENFEELARRESIDPSAKDNGGDLGSLPATQLVQPFSEAAVALEPGEISGPVQTEFGWHVILLVEKDTRPFEEVRSSLAEQAGASAFEDWLREALGSGTIEVNPRYGRFDPQTGLVEPIRSTPRTGGEETTPLAEPTTGS